MSDLPSDIQHHILIYLPAKSLFRFRSVCKSWLKIIDDQSFIKTHSTNNSRHSTALGIIIDTRFNGRNYSLSLDSLNSDDTITPQEIDVTPIEQLEINQKSKNQQTPIKDLIDRGVPFKRGFPGPSCNGLILDYNYTTEVIWNPLTRDYHKLPEPKGFGSKRQSKILGAGFGYDYAADDYKVVRIYEQEQASKEEVANQRTLVYSLRLGVWRARSQCHVGGNCLASLGVYLNGALHFATTEGIVVFDLGTEECRPLLMPQPSSFFYRGLFRGLTVLSGCLVYCSYDCSRKCFRVWMMKDYQQDFGTWMEWFSIDCEAGFMFVSVDYLESKKIVLLQQLVDNGLFWVDIENKSVKRVMVDDGSFKITSYQSTSGSLFRLDNSSGSGGLSGRPIQRNRESADDDHKRLCLRFTNISSYEVLDNECSLV